MYRGPVRLDERCETDGKTEVSRDLALDESLSEESYIEVRSSLDGKMLGKIMISESESWNGCSGTVQIENGVHGLFFVYHGREKIQMKSFQFQNLS